MSEPGRPDGERRSAKELEAPQLAVEVYDRLRKLAHRFMQGEHAAHSLQPTALVHEAYVRLASSTIHYNGKTHFYALAATQMRRVLVEHARRNAAGKRWSPKDRVEFRDDLALTSAPALDLLDLDAALDRLAGQSGRQARVAELRLFSGLTVAEVAEVLGVSEKTVKRDWRMARAWLSSELSSSASPRV